MGDVLQRIASLQTGNPFRLRCFTSIETPWPREVEYFVHRTHAANMQANEWLRCMTDGLQNIVEHAREAARQIEDRKSKERFYVSRISNGETRSATPEERELHVKAGKLMAELVPARLRLKTAENWLKAATGGTLGIEGIVRALFVPATLRFDANFAESQFPNLASQCRVARIRGAFRWRGMPKPSASEAQLATQAARAAKASDRDVVQRNVVLRGWTDRSPDSERWHDDFLQATRAAHQLEAELAYLKTELTIRLGDYDAIDQVCSFKRQLESRIDRSEFCKRFPEKATQVREASPSAPSEDSL